MANVKWQKELRRCCRTQIKFKKENKAYQR